MENLHDEEIEKIEEILKNDNRYRFEAYEFLFHALEKTCQKKYGKRYQCLIKNGCSVEEILEGVCSLAVKRYEFLAVTVLENMGINSPEDIGEITYNLIEVGGLIRDEDDHKEQFSEWGNLRTFRKILSDIELKIIYDYNHKKLGARVLRKSFK